MLKDNMQIKSGIYMIGCVIGPIGGLNLSNDVRTAKVDYL